MVRGGGNGFRKKWFASLSAALTPELMLQMTCAWMNRLTQGQYNTKALMQRLLNFVELLRHSSAEEAVYANQTSSLLFPAASFTNQAAATPLFRHGLALSWLTVGAIYACRRDDPALEALRISGSAACDALYERYTSQSRPERLETLTSRHCVLCQPPVKWQDYVGHNVLLPDAIQRLRERGKLLLSGIGGSGKSELARQMLLRFAITGEYNRVAFVQYSVSLEESFRAAFSFPAAGRVSDAVEAGRELLERNDGGRALLMIDNVNQTVAEDAALAEVATYGCDVIVTSRLAALEGFDTLVMPPLSMEDSRRLFRMHMGYVSGNQFEEIAQLCKTLRGHPLSLVTFADLCRSKYWRVSTLNEKLRSGGFEGLSFVRNGVRETIGGIFQAVFDCAALEERSLRLLQLIALLPSGSFSPDMLAPMARDITMDKDVLCDELQMLADYGWLIRTHRGYLMHTALMETLRLRPVRCDDYPLLWKSWNQEKRENENEKVSLLRETLIVEALQHISELNEDGFQALIRAEVTVVGASVGDKASRLLEKHRAYLDAHPYDSVEEAYYYVYLAYNCIVNDQRDTLRSCITRLATFKRKDLTDVRVYPSLCSVIEVACSIAPEHAVNRIYEMIRPEKENGSMVRYLNSVLIRQRIAKCDASIIEETGKRQSALLARLGIEDSMEAASFYSRYAYVLAEQGRRAEAAPYLKRALNAMRLHGYRDDSPTMLITWNAYAVMLAATDHGQAIEQYEQLCAVYGRLSRLDSSSYAYVLSNYATSLAAVGRMKEAETAVREAIRVDESVDASKRDRYLRQYNCGKILMQAGGDINEALEHARKARENAVEWYGEKSAAEARCNVLIAWALYSQGERSTAHIMAHDAIETLNRLLDAEHQHIREAQEIIRRLSP